MTPENNNLRDDESHRQADERLVHALLLHLHDGKPMEQREQRVQRTMRAIRESTPSAKAPVPAASRALRFPVWLRRSAWAAAAIVLLAVGMLVFFTSNTPAQASLNDILDSLGKPGDRMYRISMEDQPAPPERGPPQEPPPERVPRPSLDNATLYLRDASQYLLVRDDPNGGVIFDGYDGQQSWRITAGVLAETKNGPGAGGIPMPPLMANVPFTDLHQTLERIRVDYTVEQFDQAPLPSGSGVLRHALVRRNSREVKGPETIEIWANAQTGLPRRIIFDRAKLQGNREPCRLTFDLNSEAPLPADWFAPTVHITEKRGGHELPAQDVR